MRAKRVLVTGADGFIGSHLVEYLVACGYSVRAFVLYNSFNSEGWLDSIPGHIKDQIEVLAGDIRDVQQVEVAMKGMEIVFHLAALVSIPYSYEAPDMFAEVNLGGTINVLQAARKADVSHVLIASTSEVYGTAQYVPIDENHPLQAQSPYSASKIAADQMALAFYRSYELPVTLVRPFNTYGPRQSARALIPTIITQLLHRESEIRIGSMEPTRDWVYVSDTVRAFEALASSQAVGAVCNIATGKETSVGAMVQILKDVIYPAARVVQDPNRIRPTSSEVMRLLGDFTRLRTLTSWQPAFSLQEGLKETIAWFSDSENLSQYKYLKYNI